MTQHREPHQEVAANYVQDRMGTLIGDDEVVAFRSGDPKSTKIAVDDPNFIKAQALAKKWFDRAMSAAVTSFELPPKTSSQDQPEVVYKDSARWKELSSQMCAIPFPCIRIKRDLRHHDERKKYRIETDVICWLLDKNENGNPAFGWVARDVCVNTETGHRQTLYSPFEGGPLPHNIPQSYLDLIETLENSKHRYEEQRVSRQVRRREGFSPIYREYIVIRKEDVKDHPHAIRLGEIVRRHPMLHAVRGHIRKLRSGRVTTVRPHCRGKGEMFQVKEYIAEEEYVRS